MAYHTLVQPPVEHSGMTAVTTRATQSPHEISWFQTVWSGLCSLHSHKPLQAVL